MSQQPAKNLVKQGLGFVLRFVAVLRLHRHKSVSFCFLPTLDACWLCPAALFSYSLATSAKLHNRPSAGSWAFSAAQSFELTDK
jgi:hypothetical protein